MVNTRALVAKRIRQEKRNSRKVAETLVKPRRAFSTGARVCVAPFVGDASPDRAVLAELFRWCFNLQKSGRKFLQPLNAICHRSGAGYARHWPFVFIYFFLSDCWLLQLTSSSCYEAHFASPAARWPPLVSNACNGRSKSRVARCRGRSELPHCDR